MLGLNACLSISDVEYQRKQRRLGIIHLTQSLLEKLCS